MEGKKEGGGDGDEMKKSRKAVEADAVRGRVRGVQEDQKQGGQCRRDRGAGAGRQSGRNWEG